MKNRKVDPGDGYLFFRAIDAVIFGIDPCAMRAWITQIVVRCSASSTGDAAAETHSTTGAGGRACIVHERRGVR
ncbi:hypothetical protein [Lysobacter hankyongensis]|uniref:hypothetical protein n=1 Tax=Lysobacter hankyongensis TaxID=1176535 RepID=UPI0031E718CE